MEREIPLTRTVSAEERFDEVMEQHGRLLRAVIARYCPRDMAADYDDIRQEASLRLWRALADGRKIASPPSYVYRVAATVTIDAIRRVRARREEVLEYGYGDAPDAREPRTAEAAGPDRAAEYEQLMRKVLSLVAALSQDRRRAISLHLQGLTTIEIGNLLGWSEAKARNLVYRTLNEIRGRLRAEGIHHDVRRR
jgi:RNA polymerase sigma-70 factor (ECF subfamily)